MKAITDALDAYLLPLIGCNLSPEPVVKMWGICELIKKSGTEIFPWTINGREPVKLSNEYDIMIHHRIVNTTVREDPEESWGLKIAKRQATTLRTVLCYKIEVGEDYRYEFLNVFPTTMLLAGNNFVDFIPSGINEDHEAVYNEEWPEQEILTYGKQRVPWNVCAVENIVEFIKCEVC